MFHKQTRLAADFDRLLSLCHKKHILRVHPRYADSARADTPSRKKLEWIRNNLCIIQSSFKEGARPTRGAPGDASGAEVDAPTPIKCIISMRRRTPAAGVARWKLSVSARLPRHAFGNAGNAVHFALAVASQHRTLCCQGPGALRRQGVKVKCMGDTGERRGVQRQFSSIYWWAHNTTVVCGVF